MSYINASLFFTILISLILIFFSSYCFSYESHKVALNDGIMLRECIKDETLATVVLVDERFYKLFEYVEMSTFDIASDAFLAFRVCDKLKQMAVNCFFLILLMLCHFLLVCTFCCFISNLRKGFRKISHKIC